MMNDPVVDSALSVMAAAFIVTLTALYVLYRYMRVKKRGAAPTASRNRNELLLALLVGIVVPAGIFAYAFLFSPFATLSPDAMQRNAAAPEQPRSDAELLQMGKTLFGVHCAVCHGPDGNAPGGKGANLTHRISFESALLNIRRGAHNFRRTFPGGMPPMIADIDRAAQVAHYVSSGFTENEEGRLLYGMLHCARCHGDDGRGRQFLGPNIREFDLQTVALVLKNGKNGVIGKMPRFGKFSDAEVRALGLYVISVSQTDR
jgi:mono/diheme cytochrome c family protein